MHERTDTNTRTRLACAVPCAGRERFNVRSGLTCLRCYDSQIVVHRADCVRDYVRIRNERELRRQLRGGETGQD